MGLDKISELFFSGEEARKELGMTRDTFNYHVKVGNIKGTIVFGKQKKYEKKHIRMIANQMAAAILAAQVPSIHFEQATLETLPQEMRLSEILWGEQTKTYHPYRQEMLEKNPLMSHYLFDGEFLAASINMLPLSKEGIVRFKQGERGWLLGEYGVPYAPGDPLQCVIIDMMSTPLVPMQRRTSYARMLFVGLGQALADWGSRGIEIETIYANGGTYEGKHLLETAGFTVIGDYGKRVIYELEIAKADLKLLADYKKALAAWKEAHQP